jgi:hypothetical protein
MLPPEYSTAWHSQSQLSWLACWLILWSCRCLPLKALATARPDAEQPFSGDHSIRLATAIDQKALMFGIDHSACSIPTMKARQWIDQLYEISAVIMALP